MAILIDPPMWPAHGTLWSHLVSDRDYEELHAFAARVPLPRRGFDLDHYDVPASLHERVVELGATPVGAHDVVHRLRDAGLRVRQVDRDAAEPVWRRRYLVAEWAQLAEPLGVSRSSAALETWQRLGDDLIGRWNEPHRRYHDERHLEDVLLALNHLQIRGETVAPVTLLAAWFHDAVYEGTPSDEQDSARLAVSALDELLPEPATARRVGEMIVATRPTAAPAIADAPLAQLLDSDLSIFAAGEHRYRDYTAAVREEYAHVPDAAFRAGRAEILRGYLSHSTIYRTAAARTLWEARARENLTAEIDRLGGGADATGGATASA